MLAEAQVEAVVVVLASTAGKKDTPREIAQLHLLLFVSNVVKKVT